MEVTTTNPCHMFVPIAQREMPFLRSKSRWEENGMWSECMTVCKVYCALSRSRLVKDIYENSDKTSNSIKRETDIFRTPERLSNSPALFLPISV